MMRIVLAISLMALVVACAHKDAGKGLVKLSGRNNSPATNRSPLETMPFDSTIYIGYVDYFPETREFYTALFYREGHEYPDEDLLESKLDSVILFDDDWGRERLPMEEARNILVLSGLDTLSIFNRKHELICTSPLNRIEYLWNGLESYFIAVYASDRKFTEQREELYGVTSRYSALLDATCSAAEFKDDELDKFLVKKLKVNQGMEWEMRHYKIEPPEQTYSIISSYSMQSNEALSYLTALEKTELQVLNEEVNNYHFLNILPLPLRVNGKPLLLISAGYPSSDVLWDYLAGYDGSRYDAIDYNRVHLRALKR
ncbi:MAG TPA: hypothetical protein VFO54_10175 [Chryseosolibacter sp.]|nr:hypothetical protein [Chryseosolibacter sp.]